MAEILTFPESTGERTERQAGNFFTYPDGSVLVYWHDRNIDSMEQFRRMFDGMTIRVDDAGQSLTLVPSETMATTRRRVA
jgi:hypothetical protein